MSTKRDRQHLETYFETGDRPTEEEFAELIKSGINQLDDDIHAVNTETDPNKSPSLKVGIGTDDPKEKLHVNGNVEIEGKLQVKDSISGFDHNWGDLLINASKLHKDGGAYMHLIGSNRYDSNGSPNANQGGMSFVASGKGKLNGFNFFHYNQERDNGSNLFNSANAGNSKTWDLSVRINGWGNVGIGVTNPLDKLSVGGTIRTNDNAIYLRDGNDKNHGIEWFGGSKEFDDTSVDGPVVYGNDGGALGSVTGSDLNNSKMALRWKGNGNVGIGTDDPLAKLEILGKAENQNGHGIIKIVGKDTGKDLRFGVADDGAPYTWIQSHGKVPLKLNPHPAGNTTTINEGGGHVGVGTDDPKTRLHVKNGTSTDTGLRLENGADTGRILVSDQDGNATWQDSTVVTSGLWSKIDNSNHIKNGNPGNVAIGVPKRRFVEANLEINGNYESAIDASMKGIVRIQGSEGWDEANLRMGVNNGYSWMESINGPLVLNQGANRKTGIGEVDPRSKLEVRGAYEDEYENGLLKLTGSGGRTSPHLRMGIVDGDRNTGYVWLQSHGGVPLKLNPHTASNPTTINEGGGTVTIGSNARNANLNVNGEVKIHGEKPFQLRRHSFGLSHRLDQGVYLKEYVNGVLQNVHQSKYGAVVVSGFYTDEAHLPYDVDGSRFKMSVYTYLSGGYWKLKADFASNDIFKVGGKLVDDHEIWTIYLMFISAEISVVN